MKSLVHDISDIHNAAFSADSESLGRCIAAGHDVNERTRNGRLTPLHYAAMGNYIGEYLEYYDRRITIQDYMKVIRQLLDGGATPSLADADGRKPAVIAWQQAALLADAGDDQLRQDYEKLARFLEKCEQRTGPALKANGEAAEVAGD